MTAPVFADLHTHTTCSDGKLHPFELLKKAETRSISVVSITDHDTMEAHRLLRREGSLTTMMIVPGIEVSCTENGRDIHILGYFLDPDNKELLNYEQHFRADRERRARRMIELLGTIGVTVSFDDVVDHAQSAPIGRPHVAAALVERGHVASIHEAFDRYLDTGKPAYAPRSPFSIREAVDLIRRCGGVSCVAHPHRSFMDGTAFAHLLASGIEGVEVYHPSHWPSTRNHYHASASAHDLIISGGSDFHGSREYDEQNLGSVGISEEQFETLHVRAVQSRMSRPHV